MPDRKINIFVGNYGSGKTELAVNYAIKLATEGKKVALVDLDIVNLYFRSRETRDYLEANGVRLITPQGKLSAADLPALSPAIYGALQNEEETVVFDVGGDNVGATALGRFRQYFNQENHNLFFVINTCRPFTRDEQGIKVILQEVSHAARIPVTALISNSNLGAETDLPTVRAGLKVVKSLADELNLPVAFVGVPVDLLSTFTEQMNSDQELSDVLTDVTVLPVRRFMLPPWYEDGGKPMVDPASSLNRYQSMLNKEGNQ